MSRVSSRPVPPTISGWARMASATCRSGVPGGAAATAPNPRASASSEIANSGAPQPSMPTADGASSDSRATTSATRSLQRMVGAQVVLDRPARARRRRRACRRACRSSSCRSGGPAAGGEHGVARRPRPSAAPAGSRRSSSVSPARASIASTRSTCMGSPECDAAARARSAPIRSAPLRQHRDRLERLARGPREDRASARRRAGAATDAGGPGDDHGAEVRALVESGSVDPDELGGCAVIAEPSSTRRPTASQRRRAPRRGGRPAILASPLALATRAASSLPARRGDRRADQSAPARAGCARCRPARAARRRARRTAPGSPRRRARRC